MIRSLYSAASGMVSQVLKQDIIANNLANVQTPGFKRSRGTSESFNEALDKVTIRLKDVDRTPYPQSPQNPVLVRSGESVDFSQGPLQATENQTDFAISGAGYFSVISGDNLRFTRDGSFHLDKDRFLCTQSGEKVLGENGAIKLPNADWRVGDDGVVTSNGIKIDKFKIAGSDGSSTRIAQGCLEGSNVSVVREMVGMIANMRAYEANQRVIQAADQTLGKAVSEVGKVG